jgi:hypothetical protein
MATAKKRETKIFKMIDMMVIDGDDAVAQQGNL